MNTQQEKTTPKLTGNMQLFYVHASIGWLRLAILGSIQLGSFNSGLTMTCNISCLRHDLLMEKAGVEESQTTGQAH